jgi:hypothetical protein
MAESENPKAPRAENLEKLDAIQDKLDSFIETYETDMRGDKDLTNGNKGVIGEIRFIKDVLQKYPSIAFAMSKSPFKTLGIILACFVVLDTLSTFGILRWLVSFFGITIPALITKTPVPPVP